MNLGKLGRDSLSPQSLKRNVQAKTRNMYKERTIKFRENLIIEVRTLKLYAITKEPSIVYLRGCIPAPAF